MKALLCAVVLLTLPSAAHALPFVPDYLEAVSVASRFVETGTDTACINCDDLDPINDLTLTLGGYSGAGNNGFGYAGGSALVTGFLESIRDVNLTIEYDVRVVSYYGAGSTPEERAAYPLQSITYGTIFGYLIGGNLWPADFFDLVEDCCNDNGDAGGAMFLSAFEPTLLTVEQIASNGGNITFNGEVQWGEMTYTPTPEPTTLLLLGVGLIAARLKRSRGQH